MTTLKNPTPYTHTNGSILIRNNRGAEQYLRNTFRITSPSDSITYGTLNLITDDGSVLTQKPTINSKIMTFDGHIIEDTPQACRETISNLKGFLMESPLKIYEYGANDTYVMGMLQTFTPTAYNNQSAASITFTVELLDPFRYAKNLTTHTYTNISTNDTASITYAGSYKVAPTITITAPTSATGAIGIFNGATGRSFYYSDPNGISSTETVIIDCDRFTATKNNTGVLKYTIGHFLHGWWLQPGLNNLKFYGGDSGNITFKIEYRERYV